MEKAASVRGSVMYSTTQNTPASAGLRIQLS